MPYTLKTTGVATALISCVAVDDDDVIKDFKANTITLDTGVAASVATGSWKSVSRKYFVTTANGSFNYFGVRFSATQPSVDETDSDGMAAWFACHGASAASGGGPFISIAPFDAPDRGLTRSGTKGRYISGGGTVAITATDIPTDGTTKFSFGANYRSANSSEVFYGLESGSLASDGTAGSDGGFGTTAQLRGIGGADGQGNQPFQPYVVCVFNRQLTLTEMQSLHNDWFGTLFDSGPAAGNLAWIRA